MDIAPYSISLKLEGYREWYDSGYNVAKGLNNLNIKLETLAVVESASLMLNSVPAASIYIDGNQVISNSTKSIKSNVSTGKHIIKFVHPEFGSKSVTINLSNKQNKQITCYFQQQVNIQSLNNTGDAFWGTIYLNGVNTDKTTPGDLMLGTGTYKISVKKAGYQTIENEVQLNISPTLERKTHSLVFHFK